MKTKFRLVYISLFLVLIASGYLVYIFSTNRSSQAATHGTDMTLTVLQYLAFDVLINDTINFGDLTPGTPIAAAATGSQAVISTNAANGYTLAVHDGKTTTNSALVHSDTTTYVADYAGTITTPTAWTGTGLGITMYGADTTPEAKWCAATCTAYNDTDNKYAGIPETATIVHTVTGFRSGGDTSSWAFKVDVPNTQKTGSYTGSITWTALAVLS